MAWLEQTPSSGSYHIAFRFGGKRFKKSLNTKCEQTALAHLHRFEENVRLVEAGRLEIPDEANVATFLLSDGRLNHSISSKQGKQKLTTLRQFEAAFLASIPNGSLEECTLSGMNVHLRHLKRVLGPTFDLRHIELADIQRYVDKRATAKGLHSETLSSATIRKELVTLRTMWNWARHSGHVNRQLPLRGLRYPKDKDKPPFQTLACIERRICRGGLTSKEEAELWRALFLIRQLIDEIVMPHIKATGSSTEQSKVVHG